MNCLAASPRRRRRRPPHSLPSRSALSTQPQIHSLAPALARLDKLSQHPLSRTAVRPEWITALYCLVLPLPALLQSARYLSRRPNKYCQIRSFICFVGPQIQNNRVSNLH